LEAGYWRAYREFYRWGSIFRAAWTKESAPGRLRHLAYTGGWKKFEPLWDWVIRAKRVANFLPLLETVLEGVGRRDLRQWMKILSRDSRTAFLTPQKSKGLTNSIR
ncbi:MAG: hypothetical protein JXA14_07755, partial [Anaerolineae bacterium]|nr:hypothetical protein [Anaerolineae bacterium]